MRSAAQKVARGVAARGISESGFALPTVMITLLVAFGFGSVVVLSSVAAQQGTTRDHNAKAALAVAEAGVDNVLLRYNRIRTTSPADVCLPVAGSVVGAGGWCPNQVTGTLDRGAFTTQVRPTTGMLEIVSTGTIDGATRRVQVIAHSSGGLQPFGNASVIGLDSLSLNSNAQIDADVATNGNITMNSNAEINCDYAQVGVAGTVVLQSNAEFNCPPPAHGTIALPPVNLGDVATNNSNGRICTLDPIVGQQCNQAWNATTRRLQMNSNSSITLGASGGTYNYFLCQLTLNSNSSLRIAAGAKVRLYFGSPDVAPCTNQSQPLILNSNSQIEPTGAGPLDIALLVVGSDTRATNVTFNSNTQLISCSQSFVLYAPRSAINMNSNSTYCGGMAGKSILMNSNANIQVSPVAQDFELPNTVAGHYVSDDFVECQAVAPTAPSFDAGC